MTTTPGLRKSETIDREGEADRPESRQHFGISAALTTAFADDGSLDIERTATHAVSVLGQSCSSVTLFGTTGEGASLSGAERLALLEGVIGAGASPERLVAGISASAPAEAVAQAEQAADLGVETLLLPPPFYFKGVGDGGLFDWFAMVLHRLQGRSLRVVLYHIPQMTGVPLSLDLIMRLKDSFPDLVYGVKDSAGVWEGTERLLQTSGLAVLVGDERQLARAARAGAAGSISGLANILSDRLVRVLEGRDDPELDRLVDAVVAEPVTAAVKALVAHARGDEGWCRVRPPLEPTRQAARLALARQLDELRGQRAA